MQKTYIVSFKDGTYRYVNAKNMSSIELYFGSDNIKDIWEIQTLNIT